MSLINQTIGQIYRPSPCDSASLFTHGLLQIQKPSWLPEASARELSIKRRMEAHASKNSEIANALINHMTKHGPKRTQDLAPVVHVSQGLINSILADLRNQGRVDFTEIKGKFTSRCRLWSVTGENK